MAAAQFSAYDRQVLALTRRRDVLHETWVSSQTEKDRKNCDPDEVIEFRLWDGNPSPSARLSYGKAWAGIDQRIE